MKLLLVEHFHGGHHTNYIRSLGPSLAKLIDSRVVDEVQIAVTATHARELERALAGSMRQALKIHGILPPTTPSPSLWGRFKLARRTQSLVSQQRPQALVAFSADYEGLFHSFFAHRGATQSPMRSAGIFHYGYPPSMASGAKERIKGLLYEQAWRSNTWSDVLMVNPVVYNDCLRRQLLARQRVRLLPDPVDVTVDVTQADARTELGLPKDGLFIGFIGMMDGRKAIPQICEGFANSGLSAKVRLVLAGSLDEGYRRQIEACHADLLSRGRIVLIDRHLSIREVGLGYRALDGLALLQFRRLNLSANLLNAVVYGRDVLVDEFGYTGYAVRRFACGVTCDVQSAESIRSGLIALVARIESQRASPHRNALAAFHSSENYARVLLGSVVKQAEAVLGPAIEPPEGLFAGNQQ